MIVNGYVTLAQAKGRLWPAGAASDVTEDSVIEAMVEAASRQIDQDTGRRFYTTAADETRVFNSPWPDVLYVDDILSVTSIKTDIDGDGVYETTLIEGEDFALYPNNAALVGEPYQKIAMLSASMRYYFPTGNNPSVQIVGKFGRANTTVAESRIFTAPLESMVIVDNLSSITTLSTDDDADGVYETDWTVTTDYALTAVPGTAQTIIAAAGLKDFPLAAAGVQIIGVWDAGGAPANIKAACLLRCLIEYQSKNLMGGMSKGSEDLDALEKQYDKLISGYVRMIV